jgi:hypothetical protein
MDNNRLCLCSILRIPTYQVHIWRVNSNIAKEEVTSLKFRDKEVKEDRVDREQQVIVRWE